MPTANQSRDCPIQSKLLESFDSDFKFACASHKENSMRAHEIMNQFVVTVDLDDSLRKIAETMRDESVSHVYVCDTLGSPIGVISTRDVVVRGCAAPAHAPEASARGIMTVLPVTCDLDTEMNEVQLLMRQKGVDRVLVVDQAKRLVGVVSLAEIWHHESPMAAGALSRMITGRHLRPRPTGGHFTVGSRRNAPPL